MAGKGLRLPAAVLLLSVVLLITAGCGTKSKTSSPAALRLQREDLIAVSHALKRIQRPVAGEVAATKLAWPLVANGLPSEPASIPRSTIGAAIASAGAIQVPAVLQQAQAVSLTGPASQLAGAFRSFAGLAMSGWKLIGSSITEIEHGSPAGARFARENVALYIESVYDGHFSLAQIGKHLRTGYQKLGGAGAFGDSLTQAEVEALAKSYSEASDRLHPHVGVRLGS